MPTRLVNRNVATLAGRTSMRLEPEFWQALQEICTREMLSLSALVQRLETRRDDAGRTSTVRVHVLNYFRNAATEAGHLSVGHGKPAAHAPESLSIEALSAEALSAQPQPS